MTFQVWVSTFMWHNKFLHLIPGIFEKSGERKNPSYEEMVDADLNGDGILNVLDIVLLVNMILGTI